MRKTSYMLAAGLVAMTITLLITACSGTVSLSGAGGGGIVNRWRTATTLAGEIPVGRWACIVDADFESLRTSNNSYSPRACSVLEGGAIAFHPDHSGYDLKQYERGS